MGKVKATQIASYMIMPGVMPRLKHLFTSGFGYIAFLTAQIYAMVRLLPPNHPYLNPNNIGQFGIRHVIAQAADNLVLKKENIDQMLVFLALFTGFTIMLVQIGMIVFSWIFAPALAAFPTTAFPTGASMFQTADPVDDIAFMLMDQVFGIPGFFGSCISTGSACAGSMPTAAASFPWPFHTALHELFKFYSTGILIVGTLIFLYFVVIVVGETAITGTPFGQRFQNVWVPIRLVVAIGLLVPLSYGYNAGQYITLYAAKAGSSFATNGWTTYMNAIRSHGFYAGGAGANPTGERESLIGKPAHPDVSSFIEAMSVIHTCAATYWGVDITKPQPPSPGFDEVQPHFVKQPQDWMSNGDQHFPVTAATTYAQALDFFNNTDIIFRFGEKNSNHANEAGEVMPYCGEIRIPITQTTGTIGAAAVQEYYFNLVRDAWFTESSGGGVFLPYGSFATRVAAIGMNNEQFEPCNYATSVPYIPYDASTNPKECGYPTSEWKTNKIADVQEKIETELNAIWASYSSTTDELEMTDEILSRGWAGAGIWYNKIAQINGNFMQSVMNFPVLNKYPRIMENVREQRAAAQQSITYPNIFSPDFDNGNQADLGGDDLSRARVLSRLHKWWNEDHISGVDAEQELTGSVFEDTMHLIFGTRSMAAMSEQNTKTHPLTQLAMTGKGLVEASIRNVATSSATSALGGLSQAIGNLPAALIQPASSFISSTAFVGLTAGLVLYYIVPFLPFIYFFFAVASWVKTIFEAMVGVPLWALAHLRIDGEGLPGNSASNGYFLILEIFLRPILSVFGLVAATVIFTTQVRVLNFLWSLVTENLTGFEEDPMIYMAGDSHIGIRRGIIDEFFFTIIFTIIVYIMAVAAFKLIDKIPDNLLRWMGNNVSSFGDINQDSVDSLTRYAALGGATAGQQIAGGVQQLAGGTGGAMGSLLSRLRGG